MVWRQQWTGRRIGEQRRTADEARRHRPLERLRHTKEGDREAGEGHADQHHRLQAHYIAHAPPEEGAEKLPDHEGRGDPARVEADVFFSNAKPAYHEGDKRKEVLKGDRLGREHHESHRNLGPWQRRAFDRDI